MKSKFKFKFSNILFEMKSKFSDGPLMYLFNHNPFITFSLNQRQSIYTISNKELKNILSKKHKFILTFPKYNSFVWI